jgi:transcriptional regulator with XRE-family HTH domain
MVKGTQNPIDLHVGRRIQLARVMSGMSQAELGRALEITADQVQGFEEGHRVSAGVLYSIAKILGKPITFFYDGLLPRK